jgi:hypothetical protein
MFVTAEEKALDDSIATFPGATSDTGWLLPSILNVVDGAQNRLPVAAEILSTPGFGYVPPRSPPALPFGGSDAGAPLRDEYAN